MYRLLIMRLGRQGLKENISPGASRDSSPTRPSKGDIQLREAQTHIDELESKIRRLEVCMYSVSFAHWKGLQFGILI